jgi:hypothetical protein
MLAITALQFLYKEEGLFDSLFSKVLILNISEIKSENHAQ